MPRNPEPSLDDSNADLDEFEDTESSATRIQKEQIYFHYQMEGLKAIRQLRHVVDILCRKIEIESDQAVKMFSDMNVRKQQ
jgi:hypothetical protein